MAKFEAKPQNTHSSTPPRESKKVTKEVNRGTQDELEVLVMIMAENLAVRTAVMERIKQAKNRILMRNRDLDVRAKKAE